jgi:hypothetical protein
MAGRFGPCDWLRSAAGPSEIHVLAIMSAITAKADGRLRRTYDRGGSSRDEWLPVPRGSLPILSGP